MLRRTTSIVIVLISGSAVWAQPSLTLKVKPGVVPQLVPVAAHQARCVALSEPLNLLAFGHDRTYADAQVSLVKLDAKGNPAPVATSFKLPLADVLVKAGSYPLSLVFHPKKPLLYVWMEVNIYYAYPTKPDPPELAKFDHLHIYDVSKDVPALVTSLCRGIDFAYGMSGGGIAVDAEGAYLYVSNLRDRKNLGYAQLGRFPLDADGLPKVLPKDFPLAERLKELAKWNETQPSAPADRTPIEYVVLLPQWQAGAAQNFVALEKDVVLAGGPHGFLSWRAADKTTTFSGLSIKGSGPCQVSAHPKLPAVFATKLGANCLFRAEQTEGYLTGLPRQLIIPDAKLHSAAAIMSKSNQVAVGGEYQVYVVSLDEHGQAREGAAVAPVLNPNVKALVYAEKFDRLYVGVDISK